MPFLNRILRHEGYDRKISLGHEFLAKCWEFVIINFVVPLFIKNFEKNSGPLRTLSPPSPLPLSVSTQVFARL